MATKAKKRRASRPTRKVAVVTGGGTGIGRACANALTRDGYAVAVIGRRARRLEPRRGEKLHPYPCDVADHGQIKKTVAAIRSDFGRIDVLVNSAGVIKRQPLAKITQRDISTEVGINLIGTINFSLACVPALKRTKGTIINMSSGFAQRPLADTAIYAATKGGVESFSKALAVALAPSGIRVNVVSPGLVRSEIYADSMDRRTFEQFLRVRRKAYPLGRTGEPDDISETVSYLASSKASWITGVVIAVDGGLGIA
jgi:NAD(P)-dependent dehydrogenase (short-subunit alcohol dehydrogenase family)